MCWRVAKPNKPGPSNCVVIATRIWFTGEIYRPETPKKDPCRDAWFEVPLPFFLRNGLGWSRTVTGAFLAVFIIVYGQVRQRRCSC